MRVHQPVSIWLHHERKGSKLDANGIQIIHLHEKFIRFANTWNFSVNNSM